MSSEAIAEKYVTQDMLDAAISKVNQEISDLSNKVAEKIDAALHKSQEAIDEERRLREKAIEAIQEKTDKRLDAIDSKLGKLDDISSSLAGIQGSMSGWNQTLESIRNLHQQNMDLIGKAETRVDDMRDDVDELTQKQTQTSEKLGQLHKTVHGDTSEDGPDSVFGLVRLLKSTIDTNAVAQHQLMTEIQDEVRKNAETIIAMQAEAAVWEKIFNSIKSAAKAVWNNKLVFGLLLTLLTGVVFGASPDLRGMALSILREFLKAAGG